MNNVNILVFLGEKISSDPSYIFEKNEKICYYDELVRDLIKDTYFRERNGQQHPIVFELPTTPDKLINWLKQPMKHLIGGPFSSDDLLPELREEPILTEGMRFNSSLYELIEDYIDKKMIRKEEHHTDSIKKDLLLTLWKEDSAFQLNLLYKDYVVFRTFLSKKENAITTVEQLERLVFKSDLRDLFLNVLKSLYEEIPQGTFNYCEYCGWTLPKGVLECVHRRCKPANEINRKKLKGVPKKSLLRMKKGTVRCVLIPGMFELELAEKLQSNKTMFYEDPILYDDIERNGDISIKNTLEDKTVYIDCKDYQIAGMLIQQVDKYIQENPSGSRLFVYPSGNTSLSKNRINAKNRQLKAEGRCIEILSDEEVIERLKKGVL